MARRPGHPSADRSDDRARPVLCLGLPCSGGSDRGTGNAQRLARRNVAAGSAAAQPARGGRLRGRPRRRWAARPRAVPAAWAGRRPARLRRSSADPGRDRSARRRPQPVARHRSSAAAGNRPARGTGRGTRTARRPRHRDRRRPRHHTRPAARRHARSAGRPRLAMAFAVVGLPCPACGWRTSPRPARRSRTSRRAGPSCSAPSRPRPADRTAYRCPRTRADHEHDRLDEDDVRIRPGRGSRPRTRTRPRYERGSRRLRGRRRPRPIHLPGRPRRRRRRPRRGRAAQARWSWATRSHWSATCPAGRTRWPGWSGSRERTSLLRRTPDDTDPIERPVVANAETARRRRGPGRSRATGAADRPLPGRGLRRRADAVAVPDQDRPRAGRDADRAVRTARRAR